MLGEPGTLNLPGSPSVILVVGVNGTGKTTTIGKLAQKLREHDRTVLLGAADTWRAAAEEQLEIWADRAQADFVGAAQGADPAAVAYDAVEAARARGKDVAIVDTAGRLHTQSNLMEELAKVRRVIESRLEGAPHETLLVVDATTGQNGLQQARLFGETAGVTGVALTKLDGSAKGGVAVAIAYELGLPVKLIGVGEGLDDLRPFDPATSRAPSSPRRLRMAGEATSGSPSARSARSGSAPAARPAAPLVRAQGGRRPRRRRRPDVLRGFAAARNASRSGRPRPRTRC